MKQNPPKLKQEYVGKYLSKNPYTKSVSRRWTEKEIEYLSYLVQHGYNNQQIATALSRTPISIQIKRKRLSKKNNEYNKKHLLEKKKINNDFVDYIKPRTVLDLYCGYNELYDSFNVVKNDKDKKIIADYHMDALKCISLLYSKGKKFDLIDLDPYGSAFDCFDLAIKMANKGLCVTLGEMGHKRWKRLDYVERYYDIHSLDDFNSDNLIKEIIKIGLRNKKQLTVWCKKDWQNISRVWFKIDDIKITEQWNQDSCLCDNHLDEDELNTLDNYYRKL